MNEKTSPYRSLNCFLLSFYLIGISFTDLAYLKPENLVDGRIIYRRRKTHKNYNVKLFPQAEAIFNQFHQEGSKFLLPVLSNHIIEDSLEAKKLISQWIKTTNKYLNRLSL
jgi:integrase/recombinase XerD